MVKCSVVGCDNNSNKKCQGISFHTFPKNNELRLKWLNAIRRPEFKPTRASIICSNHFNEDDINYTLGRVRLKDNVCPFLSTPALYISSKFSDDESENNDDDDDDITTDLRMKEQELLKQNLIHEPIKTPHPKPTSPFRRSSSDAADSDSDGLIDDPADISDLLVFNQGAGTSAQQPSTSTAEELEYQPSRYSIVSEGNQSTVEEIVIKEEITDEEKNQCRLCLSVGRRMQELGEYAPLYRKLLFDHDYQNTTVPSFMYEMLACWECLAELRKIKRFQEKVRRANNAFETSQNQKCQNLSSLSTILIGENRESGEESQQRSRLEECVQDIKEEAVEIEVEETALPDPLDVNQDVKQPRKEAGIRLEIQKDPNISVLSQKVVKRAKPATKTTENVPKRAKLDQNVPKQAESSKSDQSGPKTTQQEENDPKPIGEADSDAIFAKVKIEIDELEKILEERRNKESFKSMKFKCDSCVLGFTDHNRLLEHNRNFHDEDVGSCECDICERRFDDEDQLSAHFRNHFVKFVCKLCNFECYTKTGRTIHFKRHKGALQGASIESLMRQRRTSDQRASASGSA